MNQTRTLLEQRQAEIEDWQKAGGIAAIILALIYVIGFIVLLTSLRPIQDNGLTAAEKIAFVLDRKEAYQAWIFIIYVFFGINLSLLVTALSQRWPNRAKIRMQLASVFGFLWVGLAIASGMITHIGLQELSKLYLTSPDQAALLWMMIEIMQNGLGGGVELVGGIWVLLTTTVAQRVNGLCKTINYLGGVIGLAGILTAIPGWGVLGAIFGLLQIIWFTFLGLYLLRTPATTKQSN